MNGYRTAFEQKSYSAAVNQGSTTNEKVFADPSRNQYVVSNFNEKPNQPSQVEFNTPGGSAVTNKRKEVDFQNPRLMSEHNSNSVDLKNFRQYGSSFAPTVSHSINGNFK